MSRFRVLPPASDQFALGTAYSHKVPGNEVISAMLRCWLLLPGYDCIYAGVFGSGVCVNLYNV